jgi:hypothetical protein
MVTLTASRTVAKKKAESLAEPKRYGTLIRVSNEFASAVKDAASFEKVSIADFLDAHVRAAVERRYRDAVLKEARRFEEKVEGAK